jgi:hypothetical protein
MAAVGSPYEPVTFGENIFGETTSTITLDIASPLFNSGNELAVTGSGSIYSNSVDFTVNETNRATPLNYYSAKARLKLKPDGRFSGFYTEFDGHPTLSFRGIFYSGFNGVGLTTNGPGSYQSSVEALALSDRRTFLLRNGIGSRAGRLTDPSFGQPKSACLREPTVAFSAPLWPQPPLCALRAVLSRSLPR